jgi:chromosome segregation ATPase
VEEKLVHHMESMALGMPLETNKTVKDVLSGITANQGFFLQGEGIEAFEKATNEIIAMIETSDQAKVSAVKDESSSVAEINDLKAGISLRDNENLGLKADIAQRDNENLGLKAEIAQRDNDISQRDAEIAQNKADISQRDNEISQRDAEIALRDAEIASLRALLSSGTSTGGSATVSIDTAAIEQEFYDKIMLAWNEKEN